MHTLNHPFFKNFLKNFFLNEKKPPIFLVTEVNRRRVEIFIVLVYNMISLLSIVPMTRESEYL